jgi:hypothetical protein
MTEYQREDELLADLLDLPEAHGGVAPLTQSEERALLHEAHEVGTPTLTPWPDLEGGSHSFMADVAGVVRRYPLPAVLASVTFALLLTRRRR